MFNSDILFFIISFFAIFFAIDFLKGILSRIMKVTSEDTSDNGLLFKRAAQDDRIRPEMVSHAYVANVKK